LGARRVFGCTSAAIFVNSYVAQIFHSIFVYSAYCYYPYNIVSLLYQQENKRKNEVNDMTKLVFEWTSDNGTKIEMTSYSQALEIVKNFGGRFVSKCIECKDADYVAPNPNTKRYKKRVIA
jgi:hypothetical protein